jgi:hypothetical protein
MNNITGLNYDEIECIRFESAANFADTIREINVIVTILIIMFGLIGNSFGFLVFIQKRFRKKSQEVFLLVLTISDGLFLLTHFFEDTLRTYIDIYIRRNVFSMKNIPVACISSDSFIPASNETYEKNIFSIINITDNFETTCKLINYFRYFLRFISAYIITLFTIQRTIAIYFPFLQNKLSSSNLAWKINAGLISFAAILCSFIPFLFKINTDESNKEMNISYCDIDKRHKQFYFITTIVYIVLIMFIPITTIIICNSLIIFRVFNASKKRTLMINGNFIENSQNKSRLNENRRSEIINESNTQSDEVFKLINMNSKRNTSIRKISNDSAKVTHMLIVMSLSFAILNLPYFVTWCMFYYNVAIQDQTKSLYLIAFINLSEIFYVLNYGIHFFLYCASGKQFRKQFKMTFKKCKRLN